MAMAVLAVGGYGLVHEKSSRFIAERVLTGSFLIVVRFSVIGREPAGRAGERMGPGDGPGMDKSYRVTFVENSLAQCSARMDAKDVARRLRPWVPCTSAGG